MNQTHSCSPIQQPQIDLEIQQQFEEKRAIKARLYQNIQSMPDDELRKSNGQGLVRTYSAISKEVLSMCDRLSPPQPDPHNAASTPAPMPPQWKTDVERFASEAFQLELFPHQVQLVNATQRINLLIAGRGAGKSVAAQIKALHHACTRPNHLVMVISSGQRMSQDFGARIRDLLSASPLAEWIEQASTQEIRLKNGSRMVFLPANPDTIRGYHPRHRQSGQRGVTVILDEACFMPKGEEIRQAAEYALITAPQGQMIIVTSPSSLNSWVYPYVEHAQNPHAPISVIQCGSDANPLITPQEIERLRESKNAAEFRAEVLGEWVESAYGLFSGLIAPNRAPRIQPAGRVVYTLGVDLALSFSPGHDRNAVAAVAALPRGGDPEQTRYQVAEVHLFEAAREAEVRQTVRQLIETYGAERLAIEHYQGKALAEYAESLGAGAQLIAPTPALQQLAFHHMHRLLRQGRLTLADSLPEAVFAELNAFQYRREGDGRIAFGHPAGTGHHDDSVYAIAWALYAQLCINPQPGAGNARPQDPARFIQFAPG